MSNVADQSSSADGADPLLSSTEGTEVSVASGPLVGPCCAAWSACSPRAPTSAGPPRRRGAGRRRRRLAGVRLRAGRRERAVCSPGDRTLWLRVGPLQPGGAQALLGEAAAPDVGSVILKLADEVHVDADEPGREFLRVRLAYPG